VIGFLELPDDLLNTPKFTVKLYTSPLTLLVDAVDSLVKMPTGCFEQTASISYPMVLGLQLLRHVENQTSDPAILEDIEALKVTMSDYLKTGY